MEWDTRIWSFFIWLIATIVFAAGLATPYSMFGNRVDVMVAYGGDVHPKGDRYGVWGEVPDELSGTFTAVRALMCVTVVMAITTLIGYILLFKRQHAIVQVVAFLAQLLAGLCAVIGSIVYRVNSDQLGEGFWMCCMAGVLYLLNGIVLIFMPIMEYHTPSWKGGRSKDQVKLLTIHHHHHHDPVEKA